MTKSIKMKFIISVVIFIACIYFTGFFTAKNVYASTTLTGEKLNAYNALNTIPTTSYVIINDNSGSIYAQVCNNPIYVYKSTGISVNIGEVKKYHWNTTTHVYDYAGSSGSNSDMYAYAGCAMLTGLYYSTFNLMCNQFNEGAITSTGEIFFQRPELSLPVVPVLQHQLQPQSLTPALAQVLGVLPILLICLVGFLALRKGLAMLSTLLRQA